MKSHSRGRRSRNWHARAREVISAPSKRMGARRSRKARQGTLLRSGLSWSFAHAASHHIAGRLFEAGAAGWHQPDESCTSILAT
jgi:hypothetical protein